MPPSLPGVMPCDTRLSASLMDNRPLLILPHTHALLPPHSEFLRQLGGKSWGPTNTKCEIESDNIVNTTPEVSITFGTCGVDEARERGGGEGRAAGGVFIR